MGKYLNGIDARKVNRNLNTQNRETFTSVFVPKAK